MSNSSGCYSIIIVIALFFVAGYFAILNFPVSLIQITDASSSQNDNYVVRSDITSSTNNSLLDDFNRTSAGELQVRYTGIIRSNISPEVARALGLNETYPGLLITEVIPNSPAEKAGLKGANQVRAVEGEIVRLGGDIIVAVDGNRSAVDDRKAFLDYLQNEKMFGENITLSILRDGNSKQANLTITPLPDFFWYINSDEGIRMKYPSDWEPSDTNLGRGDIIRFISPEGEAMAVAVFVRVIPSEGLSLDEVALREREGTSNTRPLDVKARELSGEQAYESIFYDYSENSTRKAKSTFSIRDGQIYTINFIARSFQI